MVNLYLDKPSNTGQNYDGVKIKAVNIGTEANPVYAIPINRNAIQESFNETNLSGGNYSVTGTYLGNMGVGITNNSSTNALTLTIGAITITIQPEKYFYGVFNKFTTLAIGGTSPDFDAFIDG